MKYVPASEQIKELVKAETINLYPNVAKPSDLGVQAPWQASTNVSSPSAVMTRSVAPQTVVKQPFTTTPTAQPQEKSFMEKLTAPLTWVQENLEKPWAEAVSAPFRGNQAYDEWQKEHKVLAGIAEFSMPLWWLPYGGWLAKGATVTKSVLGTSKALKTIKTVTKGLPKLPSYTEMKTRFLSPDKFRQLGERLLNSPAKPVVNFINPSLSMKQGLGQEWKTIKGGMEEIANNSVNVQLERLNKLFYKPVEQLKLDEMGFSAKILDAQKNKVNFRSVLENPDKYQLDDVTKQYVKEYGNVIDDAVKMLEEEGILIAKKEFIDGMRYVPRLWEGKAGIMEGDIFRPLGTSAQPDQWVKFLKMPDGSVRTSKVGGKQFFEKNRMYDTIEEALENGLKPGKFVDPNLMIELYLKGAYKKVVDKRLGEAVLPLGKKVKELMNQAVVKSREAAERKVSDLNKVPELVQRMSRGETLAPATLKKLQRVYPQAVSNPNKKALLEQIRIDLDAARGELGTARFNYNLAKQTAQNTMGYKSIGMPFASGRLFPESVAGEINKIIADKAPGLLTKISDVNALSRFLTTSMDFGAGFIQGIPLLAKNPALWAKAQKISFESFMNPSSRATYFLKPENQTVLQKLLPEGLMIGGSEFTEAGLLQNMPKLVDKISRRREFATAFNTFGDAARIEWGKALLPIAEREGWKMNELASFLNNATGVMSSRALGVGASQRTLESAVFLFAPRYFRATMALWADIARGGLRGQLARNAVASMLMGGFTMYYGLSKALGQEPNLDPSSSKFMTVEINGQHVGPGSMQIALMRTVGNMIRQVEENPAGFILPVEGRDSTVSAFFRGRVAPLTGTTWDILTGKTFIGEPLDDVQSWLQNEVVRKATPFWAHDVADEYLFGEGEGTIGGLPFQFTGARVNPLRNWEKRDDMRDSLALKEYGISWYPKEGEKGINDLQKKELEKKYPDLVKVSDAVATENAMKGGVKEKAWLSFKGDRERAKSSWLDSLQKAQNAYDAGMISGYRFKELIQDAGIKLRGAYEVIESNPNYASVMEFLSQDMTYEEMQGTPIEDIAFDQYASIMFSDSLIDITGGYDFELADQYRNDFIKTWGQEIYSYVQQRLHSSEVPPMMQEYYKAQEVLKPYWEIASMADRYFGKRDSAVKQRFITRQRHALRRVNRNIDHYIKLFYTQE